MKEPRTEVVSVRLTPQQHEKLLKAAKGRGWTLSDLVRRAALAEVEQPIGWRCKHFELTAIEGAIGEASTSCGCPMTPIFAGDPDVWRGLPERTLREIAWQHRDDFEIESAVAIAPWRPQVLPVS